MLVRPLSLFTLFIDTQHLCYSIPDSRKRKSTFTPFVDFDLFLVLIYEVTKRNTTIPITVGKKDFEKQGHSVVCLAAHHIEPTARHATIETK